MTIQLISQFFNLSFSFPTFSWGSFDPLYWATIQSENQLSGMKYPQLVSARAVSAISDWLVTQLEQLGVDASLVYSRLLLSLLHTPLQINALDLAEISDIKVHI